MFSKFLGTRSVRSFVSSSQFLNLIPGVTVVRQALSVTLFLVALEIVGKANLAVRIKGVTVKTGMGLDAGR
jgi:hypothetical protein